VCRCRPWLAGEREGEREEGGCGLRVELCSFDTGGLGRVFVAVAANQPINRRKLQNWSRAPRAQMALGVSQGR